MGEHKIFADFVEVECNDCARYWDSSCDAVSEGVKKPCNSFLATRSVVIPNKIDELRKQIRWLYGCVIIHLGLFILHVILQGLGWM
mgnify:CR=1 FL=1